MAGAGGAADAAVTAPEACAAAARAPATATAGPGAGWELLVRAREAIGHYQIDEAEELLRRAGSLSPQELAAPGPRRWDAPGDLELRLGITGSWVTFERRGLEPARGELAAVRLRCLEAGRLGLVVSCHVQEGVLHARSGDLTEALACLRRAEEHRAQLPPDDQARLLLNRGAIGYQLLDFPAAARDLDAAAEAALEAGVPPLRYMALHNRGCLEATRGDVPEALRWLDLAQELDDPVNRGSLLLDRARVLVEAGLLGEAREALHEAAAECATAGVSHEEAETRIDLSRVELLLGHAEEAAANAEEAREIFERRGEDTWVAVASLAALRARAALGVAAAAGEPDAAAGAPGAPDLAADALALAAQAHRLRREDLAVQAYAVAAAAQCDLHRYADAGRSLRRARPMATSAGLAARLEWRLLAARTAYGRRDVAHADRALAAAAEDLGRAQGRIAGLDARAGIAVHAVRLAELDLSATLDRRGPQALLTRIDRWRRPWYAVGTVHPSPDPAEARLMAQLRQAHDRVREASGGGVAEAVGEVRRLERRITQLRWRAQGGRAGAPSERLPWASALTVAGRRDTTIVSFAQVGGRLLAVVKEPGRAARTEALAPTNLAVTAVRRATADLEAAARAPADGMLRRAIEGAVRDSMGQLDDLLLRPLRLPAGPAVLTVPPCLAGVAWGMLPSRRGLATTLTPSPTVWATPAAVPAPRSAVVAGPALEHALPEAARVAQAWAIERPAAVAGREALIEALQGADVVHVAAHGRHHPLSPLFSSLDLVDGPVFAHELEVTALRASLVVLSACEVGRGSGRPGSPGTEPLGLAVALLALGVRMVIAPVVAIRDEATVAVMAELHRQLAGGADAATALARAAEAGTPFVALGSAWRAGPPGQGSWE